jgi:transcriptional regulator with XRE-family HTH domain
MALTEKEKKDRLKFNIEFGNHIHKKRVAKKLSTAEFARLCDMDKPNLLRIEKGRVNTSIYILNKIAKALDMELDELLKGFSH